MSVQASYCDGEEINEDGSSLINRRRKGLTRFQITIEPIKILLGFAINFTNGVTIDVLERNVCYLKYNLTEDQCYENMKPDIKSLVESMTADVNMINQLIQGIFPLLLVLFVGSWSDINGRKPFIVLPILGYCSYFSLWAILSYFKTIPIIYYFIPSIPLGLSGGLACIFVCTWSYTSDLFDPEERPLRFTISSASLGVGQMLGNALSGQVMTWASPYGFQVIFATSVITSLLALLYTIFLLEETRVRQPGIDRTRLIDFENLKKTLMVMLIHPEKGVLLSVLVFTILLCEIPLNAGDDGILYLVGKTQYGWDLKLYNLNVVISSIAGALVPVFITWLLMNVLKWSNITVLVLSLTFIVFTELSKALSSNQVMFWIAVIITKFGGFIGPALDTEISQIPSSEDTGKAFTMISICDALTPVLSIPLYTVIYKIFLPNHTLYTFFTSAFLATIGLIAAVGLSFKKSSMEYSSPYRRLEENG